METFTCTKCGESKPAEAFIWRKDRGKRNTICRSCVNARLRSNLRLSGKGAVYFQTWKTRNPDAYRARYVKANASQYTTRSQKIESRIRNAVYRALSGRRKESPTFELLGYSLGQLKQHLELRFLEGMTWENYGKWHVDHIKALSTFKIADTDCPEFREAWALNNLQPLWAKANAKKTYPRAYQ